MHMPSFSPAAPALHPDGPPNKERGEPPELYKNLVLYPVSGAPGSLGYISEKIGPAVQVYAPCRTGARAGRYSPWLSGCSSQYNPA